jgi:hypothetical protein
MTIRHWNFAESMRAKAVTYLHAGQIADYERLTS